MTISTRNSVLDSRKCCESRVEFWVSIFKFRLSSIQFRNTQVIIREHDLVLESEIITREHDLIFESEIMAMGNHEQLPTVRSVCKRNHEWGHCISPYGSNLNRKLSFLLFPLSHLFFITHLSMHTHTHHVPRSTHHVSRIVSALNYDSLIICT